MTGYVGPPLTRASLERLLAAEGISERAYNLYGAHDEQAFVLDQRAGGWAVFFVEQGQETGHCFFDSEAEACLYLLQEVWREPHNRFQLVAGPAPPEEADAAFDAWLGDQGLTRTDLREGELKTDEVPWAYDEPFYRRYFVHRKRFRQRFGREIG